MRVSTTYKIAGTKTFRLASTKILGKFGTNLQNLEKGLRRSFIPDEGKIFVQVDQSGAEALIVAYLATDGPFRELFTHKIKPHVYVALRLFKHIWTSKMREARILTSDTAFDIEELIRTPISELKEQPLWKSLESIIKDSDSWSLQERYYYLAKQTCHSGNYGVGANMFRMNILEKSGGKIVVTKDEAEYFLLTYHSLFPQITEWHERTKRQIERTGMMYNLHGHPFTLTEPSVIDSKWKEMYAWVPQSSVGEITNIAYCQLQEYIEKENLPYDLLANTHDSYLVQCPVGEERNAAKLMQHFIEQSFKSPVDGIEFTMRSEAQAGFNWSPYKKDKNPLGLKEIK